jgi:hypothetical protein
LEKTLKDHLTEWERGEGTALWDAIGHIVQTTPHNKKYSNYKPELVIFTDGEDNSSTKFNLKNIKKLLKNPGIPHVHVTIIDASKHGNAPLKAICSPIDHCSYVPVEASHEAIQRAFIKVKTDITSRLSITIELNNDTDLITVSLNKLKTGPLAVPPTINEGNSRGGRRRGRGRGRGRAQAPAA